MTGKACLFPGAEDLIDPDGAHQQDDKKDEADQSIDPAHTIFYRCQHHDRYQENGSHFVPDPQLLGRIAEDAFHLLPVDRLQGKMIEIKTQDKA